MPSTPLKAEAQPTICWQEPNNGPREYVIRDPDHAMDEAGLLRLRDEIDWLLSIRSIPALQLAFFPPEHIEKLRVEIKLEELRKELTNAG